MSVAHDMSAPTVRDQVSEEEWQARLDLAALYRLVAHYRWTDMIFTHISMRVPGPDHHFLINPYGLMFDEITASNLLKIDLDGNKILESDYDVNAAGFTIHGAIHMSAPQHECVIHTHTADGIAVAAQRQGLLPISQHALAILPDVAYHDYEGIALNHDERNRILKDMDDKHCLILRNHGLMTVGKTAAAAFMRLYFLERACSAQVRAQSGGADLIQLSQEVQNVVKGQAGFTGDAEGISNLAWPALIRQIDKEDP
ncbi:MAG: class II aldolase/adducin family protein, partial [Alphaproteobacteria bacterium]